MKLFLFGENEYRNVKTWLCTYCKCNSVYANLAIFSLSLSALLRGCIVHLNTENSPNSTQVGVVVLEKVVPSVQVIVLLPFSRNLSSHDTVSTVPASTGNVASVVS